MKSNIKKKLGAIHAFGSLFINLMLIRQYIYPVTKVKGKLCKKDRLILCPAQEFFTLYGDVTIAG